MSARASRAALFSARHFPSVVDEWLNIAIIMPSVQQPTRHRSTATPTPHRPSNPRSHLASSIEPLPLDVRGTAGSLKSNSSRTPYQPRHHQIPDVAREHANGPSVSTYLPNLSLFYHWFLSCQGSSDNDDSSPPPSTNDGDRPPLPHNGQDHGQRRTTTWVPSSTHASLTDERS